MRGLRHHWAPRCSSSVYSSTGPAELPEIPLDHASFGQEVWQQHLGPDCQSSEPPLMLSPSQPICSLPLHLAPHSHLPPL